MENIINRRQFDLQEGEIQYYQIYDFLPKIPNYRELWDLDRLFAITLRNTSNGNLERIRYHLVSGVPFYSKKGFRWVWGRTSVKNCYIIFNYSFDVVETIDAVVIVRCSDFESMKYSDRIGLLGRITPSAIYT